MTEATFWKLVAWVLGILLLGILVFNQIGPFKVPTILTSIVLGILVSIAIGYSIVCPASSPAQLSDQQEDKFRKQQYIVGVVMSIVLASTLLVKEVHTEPLSWGLIPLILLSPLLIFREYLINVRMNSHRKKRSRS